MRGAWCFVFFLSIFPRLKIEKTRHRPKDSILENGLERTKRGDQVFDVRLWKVEGTLGSALESGQYFYFLVRSRFWILYQDFFLVPHSVPFSKKNDPRGRGSYYLSLLTGVPEFGHLNEAQHQYRR